MQTDNNRIYLQTLEDLKNKIRIAQVKATLSVNSQLVSLYWHIGNTIISRQNSEVWGAKVVDRLSNDLQIAFPNMRGLSVRNIKYMRKFAETYKDISIVQQVVAQIPWGHNIYLLDKLSNTEERIWYATQIIQNGWSRNVLTLQIESGLYNRQNNCKKVSNFTEVLPAPQSDLANELLKDPYNFDFIEITESSKERDIENELVKNLKQFMLELGKGFAYIGEQYRIEIAEQDYYLDLLFYNTKLHSYVVFELKTGEFLPEYAGKMNFYLNAVDTQIKTDVDNPSIGIILCKSKNKIIAEYSLRDMSKPIGISEYTITRTIPEDMKLNLPTIEELEKTLTKPSRVRKGLEKSKT